MLNKLQKAHPEIFVDFSAVSAAGYGGNQNDNKSNCAAGQKKKSGNRRGQRGRNGKNAAGGRDAAAANGQAPQAKLYEPVKRNANAARQ